MRFQSHLTNIELASISSHFHLGNNLYGRPDLLSETWLIRILILQVAQFVIKSLHLKSCSRTELQRAFHKRNIQSLELCHKRCRSEFINISMASFSNEKFDILILSNNFKQHFGCQSQHEIQVSFTTKLRPTGPDSSRSLVYIQ